MHQRHLAGLAAAAWVAALGLLLACGGPPAFARDGAGGVGLVEDFEDEPLTGWQFVGEAAVTGGRTGRMLQSRGFATGVWHTGRLGQFVLRFMYWHGSGTASILLSPRAPRPPAGFYHLAIDSRTATLSREVGRRRAVLGSAAHGLRTGAWSEITLRRAGGKFELSIARREILVAADAAPLAVDAIGFGSISGKVFAYDHIRLWHLGRDGTASAQPAFGTGEARPPSAWRLGQGASFVVDGRSRVLELRGPSEAAWSRAASSDYTLRFRVLTDSGGRGSVSFQRSGAEARRREYRLDFRPDRVDLHRTDAGRERVLGSGEMRLAPGEWHDVEVHHSLGQIRVAVDGSRLVKVRDPFPLPAGGVGFRSYAGDGRIRIADVALVPWKAFGPADAVRKWLDDQEKKPKLLEPPLPKAAIKQQIVPLAVRRYDHPDAYVREAYRINAGNVPPNYVHTWVLDVKGLTRFELDFEKPDGIRLHAGDRITVWTLDSLKKSLQQGKDLPVASIPATAAPNQLAIDIGKDDPKYDRTIDGAKYRRVFVQLETSTGTLSNHRRFVVTGLRNLDANDGDEEALVLADDLDYVEAKMGKGVGEFGKPASFSPPWKAGSHTNLNSYPRPWASDGWYLLGKNLTNRTPLFYCLTYYNERQGRLRLYLLNREMPTNVTGATVTLALHRFVSTTVGGKTQIDTQPLTGAFFPLHPNATRWSEVTLPLINWKRGTWACVEVPVLYPMGENLPVDKAAATNQPATHFRSLYQEPLQKGLRGIQLSVDVQTYDYGDLEATLTGKAVGSAVQQFKKQQKELEIYTIIKGVAKGIETGIDIGKGVKKIYTGIKDYADKQSKSGGSQSGLDELKAVVNMGSSVCSGGAGIAGAVFNFIDWMNGLNAKPEPLQLSIELDLKAVIKGSVTINHKLNSFCKFFFPGRFSIREAHQQGLDIYDDDVVASVVPRYDRTVGLFGYKYHPKLVQTNIATTVEPSASNMIGGYMVYPAKQNPPACQGGPWSMKPQSLKGAIDPAPFAEKVIPTWLPIIYNPFADIVPLYPRARKAIPYKRTTSKVGSETEQHWVFEINWQHHVTPEPDDKQPLPKSVDEYKYGPCLYVRVYHQGQGVTTSSTGDNAYFTDLPAPTAHADEHDEGGRYIQLTPQQQCRPSTYTAFKQIQLLPANRWYNSLSMVMDRGLKSGAKVDPTDPAPLDSVLYHWDIPYFYYGRTRKSAGTVPRELRTAHLSAPVAVRFIRATWNKNTKSYSWKTGSALSTLLQGTKTVN